MNELSLSTLEDFSLLTEKAPPPLQDLYSRAITHTTLSGIDYLTIRDLVALSGYNDPEVHALLIALFRATNSGSVCLKLNDTMPEKMLPFLESQEATRLIGDILKKISSYPELIYTCDLDNPGLFTDSEKSYRPLVLTKRRGELHLYFQKYFLFEKLLQNKLNSMLAAPCDYTGKENRLRDVLDKILQQKPIFIHKKKTALNYEQILGIILPLINNFVIISGGPGTGKTTILFSILRALVRTGVQPDRIRLAAPTGRAAKKMTESIAGGIDSLQDPAPLDKGLAGIEATTIHRLLKYSSRKNDFLYNSNNPIPADVIIIDEASMIDIVLLSKLFQAADTDTSLVLMGDRNQLPSVDAGAILADLIPDEQSLSHTPAGAALIKKILPGFTDGIPDIFNIAETPLSDRIVYLRKNYRSERSISQAAEKFNARDTSFIREAPRISIDGPLPDKGFWIIQTAKNKAKSTAFHSLLSQWAGKNFITESADISYREALMALNRSAADAIESGELNTHLQQLFSVLNGSRILSIMRYGLFGTEHINDFMINYLQEKIDPAGKPGLFSGLPLMITHNDYSRGIFNGETGIVVRCKDGAYRVLFERGDEYRTYPVHSFPSCVRSFAITVHKSQGSEFERVLMLLPDEYAGQLLSKEILYTGITRAKKLAVVYADEKVLRETALNTIERESGIRIFAEKK